MNALRAILLLLTACTFTAATFAAAEDTQAFLTSAIQGDIAEVQLGKLAMSKAGSQELKDYGATLSADHTKAMQEAAAVAKALGVQPPTEPKPEAHHAYTMLSTLDGSEFDRQFIAHMIDGHRKEIELFTAQAEKAGSEVAALAQATLPTLQKHLEMAESLQAK